MTRRRLKIIVALTFVAGLTVGLSLSLLDLSLLMPPAYAAQSG